MAELDLVFYHAPRSRAGVVLWMLEELAVPYRMELLNIKTGEQKSPGYLAVNPMGKVPAINHGGTVVTECAAICCYLADAFPEAGLAPAIGDPRRGAYLRWLFFGPGCIEPAMTDRAYKRDPAPASSVGYGDFDTVMDTVSGALSRGPYLLGDRFSAADISMGSTLRYGMMFGIIPKRPEFTAYAERLEARPALQRINARDEELAAAQAA
ncbi:MULTISPECIES: glutathione S-transferase family protein [Rhodomicrobium]|uniref:glutathione S-transferase family protein n=1 Tax=Rhodomicrobium TaxID=1068 RepID=UPI000B4A93AA|nr:MULTISPECIES: glutathione S-transferase family protein [Rhodomicrobium]